MVGEDVVAMLKHALTRVGVTNVKVVAILNDTTGTLVAGSHYYPNTTIGNFGTLWPLGYFDYLKVSFWALGPMLPT